MEIQNFSDLFERCFQECPFSFALGIYSYHVHDLKYPFQGSKEGVDPFLDITRRMLYTKSLKHLRHLFKEYKSMRNFFIQKGLEAEVLNFESKIDPILTHFQYPQFSRTNNIIEEIINKLKYKIFDCCGFTYYDTAWNSIKMIILNYRFHKFTCSCIEEYNRKSPLELAGINTTGANWIKFSQKRRTNGIRSQKINRNLKSP